ncbi:ComEC/Rec2 family competence protein [Gordonia hydrophobica]|uniref:ComEC/Rec2 family competence protein n=1 Tax=Gordonia hydrophobica TaxID=40516 RepID=A0ABZ2TXR8_9ACTN|nr:ComEC/Rec2 family competence protein [Gordonia hydrophobica]MBM7366483.1 competence protein ComEC [Gordonia hydrophobica]
MKTADLRLALPAAGCWAAAAVALLVPVAVGAVLAGAVAAVGLALVVGSRSTRIGTSIALTAAAACGVTAASTIVVLLRIIAVDQAPIAVIDGKPLVEVEVAGDPSFAIPGMMSLPVTVRAVRGARQRPVAVTLLARASQVDPLPGERYRVRVRVRPPRDGVADRLRAARLTAVGELTRTGDAPWWQRVAGRVRERLRDVAARALGERPAGLLPGLVLGDVSGLDQQTSDNFRSAGLTHLVAVSGSNLVLVCGSVILVVRMTGASARTVVLVGACAIVGFVILVRPSDSVLRAAVMGSVGLLAGLGSRRVQALPALGTAVIVVILLWPQMAVAPGFALSVVATLGLVLWSQPIRRALTIRGMPDAPATLLAMTLAAQILTTPLLIVLTDTINLLAIPANLVAIPVVGMAALLGTAAAVVGALGPRYGPGGVLADFLVRAAGPPTRWLIAVADHLGGPAWSSIEVPGWVTVLVLGVLIAVPVGWRRRRHRCRHGLAR